MGPPALDVQRREPFACSRAFPRSAADDPGGGYLVHPRALHLVALRSFGVVSLCNFGLGWSCLIDTCPHWRDSHWADCPTPRSSHRSGLDLCGRLVSRGSAYLSTGNAGRHERKSESSNSARMGAKLWFLLLVLVGVNDRRDCVYVAA